MKILAIDPSPTIHAYVFWDTETHDFYGPRMGLDLSSDMVTWEDKDCPDLAAIEFPQSYGITAGMSVFATAYNAGRIYEALHGTEVALFGRPSIKGQIGGRKEIMVVDVRKNRHGACGIHSLEYTQNWTRLEEVTV